jgi:hypothetical protein
MTLVVAVAAATTAGVEVVVAIGRVQGEGTSGLSVHLPKARDTTQPNLVLVVGVFRGGGGHDGVVHKYGVVGRVLDAAGIAARRPDALTRVDTALLGD